MDDNPCPHGRYYDRTTPEELADRAFAFSKLRDLGINVVTSDALPEGTAFAVSVVREPDDSLTIHAARLESVT